MRASGVKNFQAVTLHVKRKEAGLSPEQLAVLAGVSPETVRRVEEGLRQPSARVVRALANALRLTVDDLAPPGEDPVTLRQIRTRLGFTQAQIAQTLRVSPHTVSRVERGVHRAGRPRAWAAAYRVSLRSWQDAWQAGRDARRTTDGDHE